VDPWGFLQTIALPATALSLGYIALVARITRASMQEALGEDFVRTARAKWQTEVRILFCHALPNAAAPIVTTVGVGLALLIGGVVVTESVFNIPGVGRLVVDAIMRRDYPLIQGLIIFFSGVYIVINVLIDLIYLLIDPRIRF
jgi:peptide/nickel transport system permease protein